MVDLVKIRKKAKAESRKPKADLESGEIEPVGQAAPPATPPPPAPAHSPSASTPASTADPALSAEGSPQPAALSASPPAPQSSSKLDQFKEQAGTRREGFIDEAEEAASAARLELLTFVLAGEQYALDIEHLVEIVTPRAVTRVPNADAGVVGIISLRGTIVTVVDVRRRLHHPPSTNGDHPDRRIIVVEKRGETLGFEVDRVLRVVKTEPGAIEPHPVVHASELHEAILGVFHHGSALTILLDFDKLLA